MDNTIEWSVIRKWELRRQFDDITLTVDPEPVLELLYEVLESFIQTDIIPFASCTPILYKSYRNHIIPWRGEIHHCIICTDTNMRFHVEYFVMTAANDWILKIHLLIGDERIIIQTNSSEYRHLECCHWIDNNRWLSQIKPDNIWRQSAVKLDDALING